MTDRTKAAIAILFPEPETELEFNLILSDLKTVFEGREDIRVMAAVRNAAERIESILGSPAEEIVGDLTIIGQECFTNGDVISYMGENYYKPCNEWVTALDGNGVTFCTKRVGHDGHIHEDFYGRTRDATEEETP